MTLTLPPELEAKVKQRAQNEGPSAEGWLRRLVEQQLTSDKDEQEVPPFVTGRGMLAKYGPAPSAEEIDSNRADMFHNFAQDF